MQLQGVPSGVVLWESGRGGRGVGDVWEGWARERVVARFPCTQREWGTESESEAWRARVGHEARMGAGSESGSRYNHHGLIPGRASLVLDSGVGARKGYGCTAAVASGGAHVKERARAVVPHARERSARCD
jgi:hypothetical protein